MKQIIECVPNFSEGRNMEVIDSIADSIEEAGGVKVLNVDPGAATNRTVITFAGSPEDVTEAAFQGVKRAGELIDMRQHHGEHPRLGATDVLPLVPVSGITLEECALLARDLAKRIYTELGIPCYCYEAASRKPERKNLAVCRAGEYEGLAERMKDPDRQPDFGPGEYTERAAQTGATNVGARDFLIAVNFNLNTTSVSDANAIAFEVREKGRPETVDGKTVMIPGTLKGCKAIGWFIDEYGIAQVSMNITDINTTPLHIAFEEVCRAAQARGLQVTGTEIIGLVPKRTMLEAGLYFLERQQRPTDVSEQDIMQAAVISMGLDDLKPFNVKDKVVELLIGD
jgi:glutamate formiminotransferase/formiminotetrahydrofolate cyclodeaminase